LKRNLLLKRSKDEGNISERNSPPPEKPPSMKKMYPPTKKFQCIWTTLQSRVISFKKVPAIYDTLLKVSSRCTEISWQVVTFSSCLVGFFYKKRLINKLLWIIFSSILSLFHSHFRLSLVADYSHLLYPFKENNRNCQKLKTLGRCLQQQLVSEFKTRSGLQLCDYAGHADTFVLSSFVTYVKSEMFSERADSSPCRRDPSSQSLQPTVDVCDRCV
jgi:hypothetical protein